MESADSPPTDALTRWLLAARANLAWLLFALAVAWALPTGYAAFRAYDTRQKEKPAEVKTDDDPEKPPELKADALEKFDPNRPNYFAVAFLGAVGMLAALGGAFWWLAQPPGVPDDVRRVQVRTAVLLAGLGSGLLLMLGGLWFVFDKYDILSKWLDTREGKDLWKVLVPVLVFVLGAGLAFATAQIARPEERHSQGARRLVYATNLVVTALLLFVGLGVFNIFVGTKLPNRLDTTGTGFYTLDPSTETFIQALDQKVTVYSFLQEGTKGEDEMRVLLTNAQDLNPARFVLKHYGTAIAGKDIQKIRASFPQVNLDDTAVILAMGDDEKRFSTIKHDDLISAVRDPRGRPRELQFDGERLLVRELQFLAQNQTKPAVYFTQGHGELALTAGPEEARDRTATQLRAYLEKLNFAVKPLTFDKAAPPKVPDDAAVVVVASPTVPLAPELAAELKRYMTEPRAENKKGKLIVLAGPHPTVTNDKIQPTGLEELLTGFNITLVPAVVLNPPTQQTPPDLVIARVDAKAVAADNPIVRPLLATPTFGFGLARPLELVPPRPDAPGGVETYPLITTLGGGGFPSWLEPVRPADPEKTFKELAASKDLQQKKKVTAARRPLAAVAAEGTSGRVVVIGSDTQFNDQTAAAVSRQPEDNLGNVMMVSAIDWLRDRPVVAVANKTYGVYKPNPAAESSRLLVLPLGLTALVIAGLGAGVWVVRRR